jgi:hypothetical protein
MLNAQTLLQCFSVVLAVIGISEKRKKKKESGSYVDNR